MEKPNIKLGDIVFEKDKGLARNEIKKMKQNIQKL
jgi:hypothetical protein